MPLELWIRVLQNILLYPETLQPRWKYSWPQNLALMHGRNAEVDFTMLCSATQVCHQMRNIALEIFCSQNRFILDAGPLDQFRLHKSWMWLEGIPAYWAQFLNNVEFSFDLRAGHSRERISSVRCMLQLLSTSRFLKRFAMKVNLEGLAANKLQDFRGVPIFRFLSQFRNIEHLDIDFINSVPPVGLEQWLRDSMTQQISRGLNGGKFLPCVWNNLPSLTNGQPWTEEEFDNWALALAVDRRQEGIPPEEITRRAREFKKIHGVKRATTSVPSNQAAPGGDNDPPDAKHQDQVSQKRFKKD